MIPPRADGSRPPSSEEGQAIGDPEAVVLDVGHGNAAVFLDGPQAIVVDAGPGDLVARTLEDHGVQDIAALVISHRHHDHDSELPSLLADEDLRVRRLFVNADPNRNPTTPFEHQLRGAFRDSRRRSGTELQQANETLGGYMSTEHLSVEVLAPNSDLAFAGVGAKKAKGGSAHPHAMAVVLRVTAPSGRSVFLGSDLEYAAYRALLDSEEIDVGSTVLVYPHHGGLSGAPDEEAFAEELTRAVDPEILIFSHGRERFDNPRREVVRGVRSARESPKVRIVCTQLSTHCSASAIDAAGRLDSTLESRGAGLGHSCAGSLRISLASEGPLLPSGAAHLAFVLGLERSICAPSE